MVLSWGIGGSSRWLDGGPVRRCTWGTGGVAAASCPWGGESGGAVRKGKFRCRNGKGRGTCRFGSRPRPARPAPGPVPPRSGRQRHPYGHSVKRGSEDFPSTEQRGEAR
ncbi:hypothetical protein San01_00900 [Streptomyces angustmyceticus]|uniref:Uncharacterized protein n=1 Tax=Streptomyces angustmyceticus TaxID=285578 RepID=A0A5J4L461_9ACTN|nr:hypothetical protein San01_00900 [Streptomyces angustmyceticus]